MKLFDWNDEKNELLKKERGVSFEEIVYHITHGGLLNTIEHPNQKKYSEQRIFIVNVEGYACIVPFVETETRIFLKTIIPSRKMTGLYLRGDSE
ncbi:MAG: BrnT family toxin [Candidatus Aegiribacteria sp.]|nr:BrnT family toxin [Candidatus Aegiribacteria sp.]